MAYFNFSRLIEKYRREFTVITYADGDYNNMGEYVKGSETLTTLTGAIIGYKESKIMRAEGTLTAKDKHLFMTQELDKALIGSKVLFNNELFSIEAETENAAFTGVYDYVLKYNSAFAGVNE